jgi:hypothetical protein
VSFADLLAEDRRLVILRCLDGADYHVLNEHVLQTALAHLGHQVGRDVLRADLSWLEAHLLVKAEVVADGALWLAHLRNAGEEVARGRTHPGIKRPAAD